MRTTPMTLRFSAYSIQDFDQNRPFRYNGQPASQTDRRVYNPDDGFVYVPKETLPGVGGGMDMFLACNKRCDQYSPDGTLVAENVKKGLYFQDGKNCTEADTLPDFKAK